MEKQLNYTIKSKMEDQKIGDAETYGFNLTDAAYEGDKTNWDLHLYDIQTYTKLILNTAKYGNETIPKSSFIEGKIVEQQVSQLLELIILTQYNFVKHLELS